MGLTAVSALHFSFAELTDILERCFEDYFVPVSLTPDAFALRFRAEGMSVEDSCVWTVDGEPAAIAIITRRANAARLAAFAISPAFRGKGLAKPMLAPLFETLKTRGVERFYLEVIAENTAAVALYESLGFRITQGLKGFKSAETQNAPVAELFSTPPDALLRAVFRAPAEPTPWLLDPQMLTVLPGKVLTDNAGTWAAITTQTPAPQLRFLFVEPAMRGQGNARRMLQELNARYSGLFTPVAVPGCLAPLFTGSGYLPASMAQHEMIWDL